MCAQTVRLPDGSLVTGRLVCHLGGGRVEIDVDGRRLVGDKADRQPRLVTR